MPLSAHLVFKLSCTQQDMPELPLQRDVMIMESISAPEDESTMRVPRGSTPSNHSVAIWDFVLRNKKTYRFAYTGEAPASVRNQDLKTAERTRPSPEQVMSAKGSRLHFDTLINYVGSYVRRLGVRTQILQSSAVRTSSAACKSNPQDSCMSKSYST